MSHRVIRCAKAIGVTAEGSHGGWKSLVEFAQSREGQNQEEKRNRKSKRKGEGELNSLSCSINYDRIKKKVTGGNGFHKNGRKKQGAFSSPK